MREHVVRDGMREASARMAQGLVGHGEGLLRGDDDV